MIAQDPIAMGQEGKFYWEGAAQNDSQMKSIFNQLK